jgi:hypothetical protein
VEEPPGERETPAIEAPRPLYDADKPPKSDPKSGPPSLSEWQDFIGRILIRSLTQGYVALILRDAELTPKELESIELDKDDTRDMAAPFASLANKNKWARKHGREIIAMSDSWEAVLALGIWMRRVNKLARKYRPKRGGEKQLRQAHTHEYEQQPMEGVISSNGRTPEDAAEGYSFPVVDNSGTG